MKKIFKRVTLCLIILGIFIMANNNVFADFYGDAFNWFNQGREDSTMKDAMSTIITPITTYVKIIGTCVITIATIILGLRYIFASAEGKTLAKEGAINLLVACILFFGWSNIESMLHDGTSFILYKSSDFNSTVKLIFSVFKLVAEAAAIVGILYVGIKYIFAGAQGKADLKSKSFPFVIGIILTFSTFEVLNLISKVIIESTTV